MTTQLLLDLHGCDAAVLADPEAVARAARAAALAAGGTRLHEQFAAVPARGVAGMVLLAEAQLIVHTDLASRHAAVDLHVFTSLDAERCFAGLAEALGGRRSPVTSIDRAAPASEPSSESEAAYAPLHPALFVYGEAFIDRFIDPSVARATPADARRVTHEICEQLYHFRLFTPDFCRLLLEESEHCGGWVTVLEHTVEKHGANDELDDLIEPDTTLSWARMPPLTEVYRQVIERHVRPVVEGLWTTFKLQKWDVPAVRKYEPHVVRGMGLHHDAETVGMVGYLSDGFTGGGTHFPRWNATVGAAGDVIIGSVVVYPGGVSHEHLALPITAGRRYTLANSLY